LLLANFAIAAENDTWRIIPLIQDGKVAPGWQHAGGGEMKVEEDYLVTHPDELDLGMLVYTKEKLGNCQIRIVYRTKDARSNAGVHIRIDDGILKWVDKKPPRLRGDGGAQQAAAEKNQWGWYAVHRGYEVQIADGGGPLGRTGAIYSLAPSSFEPPERHSAKWRTMVITLDGNKVRVEQDGKLLSTFDPHAKDLPQRQQWYQPKREPARPESGYIALQTHDPGDVVHFREVAVRPLQK